MPHSKEILESISALLPEVLVRDRIVLRKWLDHPQGSGERLLERAQRSHLKWKARRDQCPRVSYPVALPITERVDEIRRAVLEHQVVIVAGETGSGKTTQLPKICLEAGLGISGKIACTQPRRVAALSVSKRIAEELKVEWGKAVGAKIRFTDRTGDETHIKMLTDGMLLAEIQGDGMLSEYDAVIVDEAHERSLNIDFLLGYLHQIREARPDLKIIVTSATIDTAAFSKAFDDAPVISVSGRTFPVNVTYAPLDELLESNGEGSYVEGAAEAIDRIIAMNVPGDVLVFLPGERDIRELRDLLEGKRFGRVEVLPLFGRLSNAEQERIFAPTQARKIVLATNIAETSLTIPGIRYVIDTGLVRMSRYNARTHTRRLPIEGISQSSADQRKGRAGRVEDGECIRLYSEKDYLSRPKYSTPEIMRSNLAEVILRMVAFKIGEIETFPLLDRPTPAAIRAGYSLLQDLGALDADRNLTEMGGRLARLPCDPTVGRMLIQAQREGSEREVLVIAAALSIQDPRERPLEKQAEADAMHRKFRHPESDFCSLLNIWDAYHDETERLTQRQLRQFCKSHFVSYLRMREWRDVHQQLKRVLDEMGQRRERSEPATYDEIHRAILSGLLANVAEREAGNHYLATQSRKVMLFPGSDLFDKQAAKTERKLLKGKQKPTKASGTKTPPWIMCAEWMETTKLFARTVARIESAWLLELGAHLLQSSYSEPYYEASSERVLVKERLRLYGLEVAVRRTGYLKINPSAATEMFIESALVEGELKTRFRWFEANQELRSEFEDKQTRLRQSTGWQMDMRVEHFYKSRLKAVGSVADLHAWLKKNDPEGTALLMTEADLLPEGVPETEAFPDTVQWDDREISIAYSYKPGEAEDGATLKVPVSHLDALNRERLDWAIPGYVRDRIDHLLKGLPKETRRRLHPLNEKVETLVRLVSVDKGDLKTQLTQHLSAQFNVRIWPDEWEGKSVPDYLLPRIEVVDGAGKTLAAGRDLAAVNEMIEAQKRGEGMGDDGVKKRAALWQAARKRLEREGLSDWSFADFEAEVTIGKVADVPVLAYPGLEYSEAGSVNLRLFPRRELAEAATPSGFQHLLEQLLSKELMWLERDLKKELKRVKLATVGWIPYPNLERQSWEHLRRYVLAVDTVLPLRKRYFEDAVEGSKERIRGLAIHFVDVLERLAEQRKQLRVQRDVNGIVKEGLERLLSIHFLSYTPYDRLLELNRYLTVVERRLESARVDPKRDLERAELVHRYARVLDGLEERTATGDQLRWLLEEYRISVFAQNLGTKGKVSPKILDRLVAELGRKVTVVQPTQPARAKESDRPTQAKRKLEQDDLKALKDSLMKGLFGS